MLASDAKIQGSLNYTSAADYRCKYRAYRNSLRTPVRAGDAGYSYAYVGAGSFHHAARHRFGAFGAVYRFSAKSPGGTPKNAVFARSL